MMSRREMVTAGVMSSLAAAPPALANERGPSAEPQTPDSQAMASGFKDLDTNLKGIRSVLDQGLVGPSLGGSAYISKIREQYRNHLRSTGRFPEFMEIGLAPFYDVYDWHVRNMQQIVITRAAENRMAIQFMFTQLILRWEQDDKYVGLPYDSK